MITIQDVARHAGVSIATVSRVLNGSAYVSADKAGRVRASVDALKYQPNRIARPQRSSVIGLLVSNIQNPFFTALVQAIEATAQRNGYSVILANANEDYQKERQCIEVLCAEQVAGVIVIPTRDRQRSLSLLRQQHIPVVAVDRRVEDRAIDAVVIDNVGGARMAVAHLLSNGYHRIGLITGPRTTTTGRERLEGYRQALREAGLDPDPTLECYGSFKEESGRLLAEALLDRVPPPDALFVCNNLMTLGALDALYARGLRLPDDIAMVGFDEMPWAALSAISLTTVMQPVYELGNTAALRLFQRLQDSAISTRQEIMLSPVLCVRGSSRPRIPPVEEVLK